MSNIITMPSTHAARFERYYGAELTKQLSTATDKFYHPIPVAGAPGRVFSHKGDLVGVFKAGQFGNFTDYSLEKFIKRFKKTARSKQLNTGFASLSDLITEATTGGKQQTLPYCKSGSTGVVAAPNTLWRVGNFPSGGGTGANLTGGGTNCTRSTAGALGQSDPGGSDTLHLTNFNGVASIAAQTLLLYDRIWHGVPTITSGSGTPISITMTPARYAGTGSSGSSKGNFISVECTSALAATAHNHTVQYVDDNGNAAEATSAQAGLSSCIIDRLDISANMWFLALNSGDLGLSDVTQYTISANVASGAIQLVLGHPLGLFPTPPLANQGFSYDLINSAFNLSKVEVDACLTFFEVSKSATTATNYQCFLTMVSG